jgi:hypothetical protein
MSRHDESTVGSLLDRLRLAEIGPAELLPEDRYIFFACAGPAAFGILDIAPAPTAATREAAGETNQQKHTYESGMIEQSLHKFPLHRLNCMQVYSCDRIIGSFMGRRKHGSACKRHNNNIMDKVN